MQQVSVVLPSGLQLIRVCPDGVNVNQRCGTEAYWAELIRQVGQAPVARYFNSPSGNGANKFLGKVALWVYDPSLPLPREEEIKAEAYCEDMGEGYSVITLKYFTTAGFPQYRVEGAVSHELGHAWHNFCRCFYNTPFGRDFRKLWAVEASVNDTVVTEGSFPWNQGQSIHEEFANAFRYFGGCDTTRGKSGPGTPDKVVPGFEDPAARPDWRLLLEMLPETQAMAAAYGYVPGTMAWRDRSFFQMQVAGGTWVAQTGPFSWWRWVYKGGAWGWEQWSPSYRIS